MAFDALNYNIRLPMPMNLAGGISETYTTDQIIKGSQYIPGQYAYTWDRLYGYRVFKLMKNLSDSAMAQGDLLSYVDVNADVGTITAGTTTSIITSGLTANDFEYQMIIIGDDAGGASAAPEGEASLCIGNNTTTILLDPEYAFSAAVAASDVAACIYINGVEDAASSDERGFGLGTIGVAGVAYGAPADNSWFWVLQKGWCSAKCTDALTQKELVAGTKLIQDASEGAQELVIGQCPVAQFNQPASGFATVYINVLDSITITGTP